MTHRVIWQPEAMSAFRRLRADDPDGAKRVASAVRSLAADPYPTEGTRLGGTAFHRLRLGDYRVLYEISATETTVYVLHAGRLPRGGACLKRLDLRSAHRLGGWPNFASRLKRCAVAPSAWC
jgi:mRNA interferase RelE/StbE